MAKKLIEEDLRLNILVNGDAGKKAALDAAKTFDELGSKLEKAKKELDKIDAGLRPQGYENAQKKVQALSASYEKARQRMESLNRQQQVGTMTMGELQRHIRLTSIALRDAVPGTEQWNKFNAELKTAKNRLRELSSQSVQTEGVLKRFWTSAAGAVAMVQAGWAVLMRVASGLRGAFDTLKDFEQANVNLATILGKNVREIADLTELAERLGSSTRYTASQVTGLQTELAKMGFTESQIKAMAEPVLNFATALSVDLPEAAALSASALRMFGLKSKDTEDTLAAITISTNRSALNFGYLETALSTVGPVARTFGFDIKDTVALLGALANAGFDASSAATATRNILLKLADSNGKLAKELGGPCRTLPELVDGLKKLDKKGVDLSKTLDLVGVKAVSAFNTFLRSADDVAVLRGELEDTSGVLKEIAEERANTLQGSLDRLKSAWEGLILKMKGSTGVLKNISDMLGSILQNITPGHKLDYEVDSIVKLELEASGGDIEQAVALAQKRVARAYKNLEKSTKKGAIKRWEFEVKAAEEALGRLRSQKAAQNEDGSYGNGGDGGGNGGGGNGGGGGGGNNGKSKKTWSLQSDQGYLAAKAELTRQFNEGQIKSQEEYEEQLYQLEVSSLKARLALGKEKGTERLKIENDIQDKTMAHNANVRKQNEEHAKKEAEEKKKVAELEKAGLALLVATEDKTVKAAVESENKRFDEEKKKYAERKGQLTNYQQIVEALERQHLNNLRKIELDSITKQQNEIEAVHKTELARILSEHEYELQLETTSSARKLEIQRDRNKAIADENKRYLDEQYKLLQAIVSSGKIEGVSLSEDQLNQYKTQLNEIRKQLQDADAALDNLNSSSMFSGTGDGSLFGVKQSDWEAFFQNLEDGTLKAKDLQNALDAVGGMAQEGFKLANQAIQLTNAKEKKALDDYKKGQESKKKSLEDRYKAGLMTESQYNAEVEQMEADMQANQEEMELTQAKRTKAMSIVESIINTALGVTKTLAQWGFPEGIAPAAIIAAMGAAQTAMIAAQPVGYAEGGFVVRRRQDGTRYDAVYAPDKRGYVNGPTVLVGEEGGEYVIPAEALKNPDIRAYADAIESARRTGRLRSLRLEAVNPAAAMTGRAAGGYTQETSSPAGDAVPPGTVLEIGRLRETVDRLSSILEDGIEAEVVMTGRKGLVRRLEDYNRMKNRGQL